MCTSGPHIRRRTPHTHSHTHHTQTHTQARGDIAHPLDLTRIPVWDNLPSPTHRHTPRQHFPTDLHPPTSDQGGRHTARPRQSTTPAAGGERGRPRLPVIPHRLLPAERRTRSKSSRRISRLRRFLLSSFIVASILRLFKTNQIGYHPKSEPQWTVERERQRETEEVKSSLVGHVWDDGENPNIYLYANVTVYYFVHILLTHILQGAVFISPPMRGVYDNYIRSQMYMCSCLLARSRRLNPTAVLFKSAKCKVKVSTVMLREEGC